MKVPAVVTSAMGVGMLAGGLTWLLVRRHRRPHRAQIEDIHHQLEPVNTLIKRLRREERVRVRAMGTGVQIIW